MQSTEATMTAPAYDADEIGQYRSVSTMAVLSVVLGVCSALMFVGPPLVIVPLAAIATALLALRGIARSDGGLTGSSLARLGIALAVMFWVAATVRLQARDSLLTTQADDATQTWLDLASQGNVDGMLQLMTKDAAEKLMPPIESGQPVSVFGGMLASALMRQDPLVVSLKELRSDGDVSYRLDKTDVFVEGQPMQARLNYVATSNAATGNVATGGDGEQRCEIGLKRYRVSKDKYAWLIDSWSVQ